MAEFSRSASTRRLSFCLLALALAMATLVFLHFSPGAMSFDSLHILAQARSGVFEDGHPPLLAAIWRLVDRVVPGPAGMLVLNLALFYGGLLLIFRWAAHRYGYVVCPFFVALGLSPPVVGILGVIWIDITMAGFFLGSIGVFLAGYASTSRRTRLLSLLLAVALATLALAVRHNGVTGAFPLLALFLLHQGRVRAPLPRFIMAIGAAAGITLLLFVGTRMLSNWAVDSPRHLWRVGALYDIVGVSYQERTYLFYPDVVGDNSLENVYKLYSPRSFTPLVVGEQIHALPGQVRHKGERFNLAEANPELNQRLLANWWDVIASHPRGYLTHRYAVFDSLISRSPYGLWAPVFDTIDPNQLGVPARTTRDSPYFDAVKSLAMQSLVFVPGAYLVVSLLAVLPTLVFGLRRRNDALLLAAALYGSGLVHMIGLFFLAASADFRYSHWMIVTTTLGSVLVLLELLNAVQRWWVLRSPTQGNRTI